VGLQRQVYVLGRAKTGNERIYYNVDTIHQAIADKKQIAFYYYEYTVGKQKSYRRNGKKYVASPCALSWNDEYYYMIAYYEAYGGLSHFRVDKMEGIEILEESSSAENLKSFDLAGYTQKAFHMFRGPEEDVVLRFDNSLIGVVIDRFGKDVTVIPDGDSHFVVHVRAFISPTLLGWLFGFGDQVRILSPDSLRAEFSGRCGRLASAYQTE